MRLQTKLSATAGAIFMIGSLIINGANSLISRREAIKTHDRTIEDALNIVRDSDTQDVSQVLGFADTSPLPITALLFFDDTNPIVLFESASGTDSLTIENLEITDVARAVEGPIDLGGENSMRIGAHSVGNGEWLVVGLSITNIEREFKNSLIRSLALASIIALFMVFLLRLLIIQTIRPITFIVEDAKRIAAGSLDVKLREANGNNEISQLTESLNEMLYRLQDAVIMTKNSEKSMKDFMSDASHELRSPLTVIRGYVDILAENKAITEEQRERAIFRLRSESLRMSKTVDDLLTLAQIGEIANDQTEKVNLSDIVSGFIGDFSDRNSSRTIHTNIEQDIFVEGNSDQLARMISNIISNIERHTPESAEVEVFLRKDGIRATLIFDDGGPGLSDVSYKRMSDEFQRFDSSHSKSGGGFGLGLSILSAIVKRHAGELKMSPSHLGGLKTQIGLPTSTSKN